MARTELNTYSSTQEDLQRKQTKDLRKSQWTKGSWLCEAGFGNILYHVICHLVQFHFLVLSYVVKFSDDPSGQRKLWNRTEALTASGIPRSPNLWLGLFFPTSPIIAFLLPLLPPKAFLISRNNIFTPSMYYALCFPQDFSNNKCLLIPIGGKALIFLEKL